MSFRKGDLVKAEYKNQTSDFLFINNQIAVDLSGDGYLNIDDICDYIVKGEGNIYEMKDACKTVVDGYESDGFELMETRDFLFYTKCRKSLNNFMEK